MIIRINGTDYSSYVTRYEADDDSNVLLKSSQMASGAITQVYAPYTKTSLKVSLKLNQSQIQSLYASLGLSNTIQYYSAKTGQLKTALFSYSDGGYRLRRKTASRESYDEIDFTFTKVGNIS